MNRVFADTNFWIALFNPRDPLHKSAKAAEGKIGQARIVTTDEVLTEFLNHYSKTSDQTRAAVAKLVWDIRGDRKVDVIPQSRASFDAGLAVFEARLDKQYSLVDCSSFATMRAQGLQDALTADPHFRQESFNILMV